MVTMKHHHARGPEETVCDLPPVVPTERASRKPNMPAGSRNARLRVGKEPKPVGAAVSGRGRISFWPPFSALSCDGLVPGNTVLFGDMRLHESIIYPG
jgi:hypothetical protein